MPPVAAGSPGGMIAGWNQQRHSDRHFAITSVVLAPDRCGVDLATVEASSNVRSCPSHFCRQSPGSGTRGARQRHWHFKPSSMEALCRNQRRRVEKSRRHGAIMRGRNSRAIINHGCLRSRTERRPRSSRWPTIFNPPETPALMLLHSGSRRFGATQVTLPQIGDGDEA